MLVLDDNHRHHSGPHRNWISMQRVNMQRVGSIAIAVVLGIAAGQVNACSVPAHPTFEQSLANATSAFIFRLD